MSSPAADLNPKTELFKRIKRDRLFPVHVAALLGISTMTAESLVKSGRAALPAHVFARVMPLCDCLDALHAKHQADLRLWLLREHLGLDGRRPIDVGSSKEALLRLIELD